MLNDETKSTPLLFPLGSKEAPPSTTAAAAADHPKSVKQADPPQPQSSLMALSRDELLEQVFQSMCRNRRWERQRLLGANDDELSIFMGNAHCVSDEVNLVFQTNSEPALTITYRMFNQEITTATFAEIAQYVRRIAEIPEPKSESEQSELLAHKLDEIREDRRCALMSYIRGLTGEKLRARKGKRPQDSDSDAPSIAEQIASLLFAKDCLTDASDRRLLFSISRLLHAKSNLPLIKAVEDAISIIKRARMQWESYTSYWTGETRHSPYIPGQST